MDEESEMGRLMTKLIKRADEAVDIRDIEGATQWLEALRIATRIELDMNAAAGLGGPASRFAASGRSGE